jgi:hypothetical protein
MDIPKSYIIHDTRISKDFKGVTICGYKRLDVVKEYQNSIIKITVYHQHAKVRCMACHSEHCRF